MKDLEMIEVEKDFSKAIGEKVWKVLKKNGWDIMNGWELMFKRKGKEPVYCLIFRSDILKGLKPIFAQFKNPNENFGYDEQMLDKLAFLESDLGIESYLTNCARGESLSHSDILEITYKYKQVAKSFTKCRKELLKVIPEYQK